MSSSSSDFTEDEASPAQPSNRSDADDESSDDESVAGDQSDAAETLTEIWTPAAQIKKDFPTWDNKYVPLKSRFASVRRGRRRRFKLQSAEDFAAPDRGDMYVSDLVNYLGVWIAKGDLNKNCERLNALEINQGDKVIYFEADGVSEDVSNEVIFQQWYKEFLAKKRLPQKLILKQDSNHFHSVDYSLPMGDEWSFTENPLNSQYIGEHDPHMQPNLFIGDSKFLGRVYIHPDPVVLE